MKKLLLSVTAALIAMSCQGPVGPAGEGMNWFIRDYTVSSSSWQQGDVMYYFEQNIPQLDQFVYDDGSTTVYMYAQATGDPGSNIQTPLPCAVYYAQDDYLWTMNVTYDYSPGLITFCVIPSDFIVNSDLPPTMKFRVVLQW